MVKNLDHTYETEYPNILGILYAPIHILGGWKGILAISVAIAMYGIFIYFVLFR